MLKKFPPLQKAKTNFHNYTFTTTFAVIRFIPDWHIKLSNFQTFEQMKNFSQLRFFDRKHNMSTRCFSRQKQRESNRLGFMGNGANGLFNRLLV